MDAQNFKELIDNYLSGTLGKEDQARLRKLLDSPVHLEELRQRMDNELASHITGTEAEFADVVSRIKNAVEARTVRSEVAAHRLPFIKSSWFRYAAAVIVVFSTAAYFWTTSEKGKQPFLSNNKGLQTGLVSGHDRAILTLANGQQIMLDSTQGDIVKQTGLTVVNLAGKLKYEGAGTNAEYNIISTPKGGQYQIVLPDGSKVWLNAASSIKFPTAFKGGERRVEMKGEAYMEVARNPNQSFVVSASGAEIQVLGTSFNVNAYEDERALKTTLISGSVRVLSGMSKFNGQPDAMDMTTMAQPSGQRPASLPIGDGKNSVLILKPGQQAVLSANQQPRLIDKADVEQALAWKNGVFQFNHTNIAEIMRQLARWYDLELVYENGIPDIRLDGKMKRDLSLSQMLDFLGEFGMKYRMERKRLIIME